MQVLLIIQELHGLTRDSIFGYEKVMSIWSERPEYDEIENIQVNRRVILQELRKTIERHKGNSNSMAPSEGYKAINERNITAHPSEVRGVLDDLLRGENYYVYRIEDAQTRFPAVTAHLINIHSTVRDNRNLLSAMLARETIVNSISIDNPLEQIVEVENEMHENHLMAAPIDEMVVEAHAPHPIPAPHYTNKILYSDDVKIPVSFRDSANIKEATPLLAPSKEDKDEDDAINIIEDIYSEDLIDEKTHEIQSNEDDSLDIRKKVAGIQVFEHSERSRPFVYDIDGQSSGPDIIDSDIQDDDEASFQSIEFEVECAFKPQRNSIIRKPGSFDT